MSVARTLALLGKDLKLGPRSPIFLWALVLPVAMTLLIQGVSGSLFEETPRLGIVDVSGSEITAAVAAMAGIELMRLDDAAELRRRVQAHDLDGGLVLPAGFDEAVRAGQRPLLEFFVSGESLSSHRVILAVTTIDLVREVEGRVPPVEIEIVRAGAGEALPIADRLVPLLLLLALLIGGLFVTASSLVDEREHDTLNAVLVTPAAISEVLVAKGALGLALALVMAIVTLALNGVLVGLPAGLALALLAGAVMSVEIGLLYATLARDTKALYALFKSLNLLLMAPVVFYLFPDWPQWIARLFPTYWFLNPVFEVTVWGASLAEVAGQLLVAAALCLALIPVIVVLARRMQAQLAAG